MKTLSIRTFTPEQLELRAKWKAALRSGEFKQATGRLRDRSNDAVGYCCLGVAAVVAGAELKGVSLVAAYKGEDTGDHVDLLPEALLKDLGLTPAEDDGLGGDDSILAGKNDNGATFAEIADLLDAQEAQ